MHSKIRNFFAASLLAFSLFGIGCGSKNDDVDVSKVKIDMKSKNFYKDFAALDTVNFGVSLKELSQKYPDFTNFYLDTLLPFDEVKGQYENAQATATIKNIFSFKDYVALTDTVLKVFPDTKKYDEQIDDMLKHVKYYLPSAHLPTETVYFVSCLNKWTAFIHGKTLGIGLDMFLGQNFRPYEAIALPQYALINHTPENIPMWAAMAVYQDNFEGYPYGEELLKMMIENGKEIYYLQKVLPNTPMNLILGYSPEQYKWCEENEALIYNLFVQQNLLYEKDQQKVTRYVIPGPNSAGFPPEAPGNIGTFIGYKIIRAYQATTGKSVGDILNEKNINSIFQASKYKP